MEIVGGERDIDPSKILVQMPNNPDTSESEGEDNTVGRTREESDSDSSDSQDTTCWKRRKRESTNRRDAQSAEGEVEMANNTNGPENSAKPEQSDDPVTAAITDVIPVIQGLTKQVAQATKEWMNLKGVYQSLDRTLQEHIRVMEQNNEYHRYRLLVEGGMHRGAAQMISQCQTAPPARSTLNLQRVDRSETSNISRESLV